MISSVYSIIQITKLVNRYFKILKVKICTIVIIQYLVLSSCNRRYIRPVDTTTKVHIYVCVQFISA